MSPLYLVSCVAKKATRPAPAKDLYTSPWFRAARAYVEATGHPWRILSAAWGLVDPSAVLAPYQLFLRDLPAWKRRQWAEDVRHELVQLTRPGMEVVLLAGAVYRAAVTPLCQDLGCTVEAPLAHFGIGNQIAYLRKETALLLAPKGAPCTF